MSIEQRDRVMARRNYLIHREAAEHALTQQEKTVLALLRALSADARGVAAYEMMQHMNWKGTVAQLEVLLMRLCLTIVLGVRVRAPTGRQRVRRWWADSIGETE